MKTFVWFAIMLMFMTFTGCRNKSKTSSEKVNPEEFPGEMVRFSPYESNPVFEGTGNDTWDEMIRERGFILYDEGIYKLWYSGYKKDYSEQIHLGYATSNDGIKWTRFSDKPVFSEKWTEDMFVMKYEGIYYMYAEGLNDVAHLLISRDGIKWEEQGDLVIRTTDGKQIPGPYGTPNVWIEDGKWYLFYEREDLAIWLAQSGDHINWTNIRDEPVLKKGPESYDAGALAANQVVKYKGRYYMYYHATSNPDWTKPGSPTLWTSSVAMSTDLINWKKYPDNPIVKEDLSSPILVPEGDKFRLYTMHPEVHLHFSK